MVKIKAGFCIEAGTTSGLYWKFNSKSLFLKNCAVKIDLGSWPQNPPVLSSEPDFLIKTAFCSEVTLVLQSTVRCSILIDVLKKNLFLNLERDLFVVAVIGAFCTHWLISACALTQDGTHNLGALGCHCNPLSYPAKAFTDRIFNINVLCDILGLLTEKFPNDLEDIFFSITNNTVVEDATTFWACSVFGISIF